MNDKENNVEPNPDYERVIKLISCQRLRQEQIFQQTLVLFLLIACLVSFRGWLITWKAD